MMDPRPEDCGHLEECKGEPSVSSVKYHQTYIDSSTNYLVSRRGAASRYRELGVDSPILAREITSKNDVVPKSESPSFEPTPITNSTHSQPYSWDVTPLHNNLNVDNQHRRLTERGRTHTIINIHFTFHADDLSRDRRSVAL